MTGAWTRARRAGILFFAVALVAPSGFRGARQAIERRSVDQRLVRLQAAVSAVLAQWDAGLASWATIGGCGAGATTGSGGSVRWVGRNVSGGLFQVMTQVGQTRLRDGRQDYVATLQITEEIAERWRVGLSAPYLYKVQHGFPRADLQLSNKGSGDLNLMATRRLGPIGATALTLWVGLPTGASDASWHVGSQSAPLPLDLQLGLGRPTASLVVDHTMDKLWGVVVAGATANYRGGTNRAGSARAANASVYGHAGYFLGPFVPAVGLTLTGAAGDDYSLGRPTNNPRATVAVSGSVEWATDQIAFLLGVSLPYAHRDSGLALQPWVLGVGLSFAP